MVVVGERGLEVVLLELHLAAELPVDGRPRVELDRAVEVARRQVERALREVASPRAAKAGALLGSRSIARPRSLIARSGCWLLAPCRGG